jgi:glutamate/tyrosine decarboxylase-like PLP-dependent enzyme
VVEQVTREWIVDLLGLPADASIGFVTGTQMGHVTGLAAARFHVLPEVGWDVGREGLQGAPRIRVFAGAKRHVTLDRALRLLGLGAPTVVEVDAQGRMRVDALVTAIADRDGPTIVCAQAGEVNTA